MIASIRTVEPCWQGHARGTGPAWSQHAPHCRVMRLTNGIPPPGYGPAWWRRQQSTRAPPALSAAPAINRLQPSACPRRSGGAACRALPASVSLILMLVALACASAEIGRAPVWTTVHNAQLECRLLIEKHNTTP